MLLVIFVSVVHGFSFRGVNVDLKKNFAGLNSFLLSLVDNFFFLLILVLSFLVKPAVVMRSNSS